MNRVIKFCGKRTSDGEWVYGMLTSNETVLNENGTHVVHPESVGQFTGEVDKTGTEIYEGHKVQLKYKNISTQHGKQELVTCIVMFHDQKWCLKGSDGYINGGTMNPMKYTVIGFEFDSQAK